MLNNSGAKRNALLSCALFFLMASASHASGGAVYSPQNHATGGAQVDADVAVRQLTDRDPFVRQRAAEALARLAATEKRKLIEGYRLQEKNARARLALDWALYRMGKTDALFAVVRDLDSSRTNQSEAYLAELETPEPLYKLLSRVNGHIQIKLLEALARTGNAETLEIIEPYAASFDPKIADAARFAKREITLRLAAPQTEMKTRARQAGEIPAQPQF
ncbi:MAG: hypothetical protein ACR2G4_08310 [Pyrinomonadaceae bacterium]